MVPFLQTVFQFSADPRFLRKQISFSNISEDELLSEIAGRVVTHSQNLKRGVLRGHFEPRYRREVACVPASIGRRAVSVYVSCFSLLLYNLCGALLHAALR